MTKTGNFDAFFREKYLTKNKNTIKRVITPDNVLPLGVRYNSKTGKYTSEITFTGGERPIPLSDWDTAEEAFVE